MAIWPFNRNKQDEIAVPQEIQEYYQAERRDRAGVAWLLALGTLVATVVLALGLFYGGRWAYRQLTEPDSAPETAQTDSDEEEEAGEPAESPEPESPATTPQPTPTQTPSQPSPTVAGNTTPTTPSGGTTTTPQTGSSTPLPTTGPADTAGIFVATTLGGALAHRLFWIRRR